MRDRGGLTRIRNRVNSFAVVIVLIGETIRVEGESQGGRASVGVQDELPFLEVDGRICNSLADALFLLSGLQAAAPVMVDDGFLAGEVKFL